jgi:hypothetical protein
MDRRTDMKLIVDFCNFAKTPENQKYLLYIYETHVRYDAVTVVVTKIQVFWDVTM